MRAPEIGFMGWGHTEGRGRGSVWTKVAAFVWTHVSNQKLSWFEVLNCPSRSRAEGQGRKVQQAVYSQTEADLQLRCFRGRPAWDSTDEDSLPRFQLFQPVGSRTAVQTTLLSWFATGSSVSLNEPLGIEFPTLKQGFLTVSILWRILKVKSLKGGRGGTGLDWTLNKFHIDI